MTRRDWLKGISGAAASASAQSAGDTLYVNGNIVTLDAANRVVTTLMVRDGKVLSVGSEAASRNARKIDLRGRTLLPGLYAAHDHFPSWGSVALFEVDLNSPPVGKIETMADLIAVPRASARSKLRSGGMDRGPRLRRYAAARAAPSQPSRSRPGLNRASHLDRPHLRSSWRSEQPGPGAGGDRQEYAAVEAGRDPPRGERRARWRL